MQLSTCTLYVFFVYIFALFVCSFVVGYILYICAVCIVCIYEHVICAYSYMMSMYILSVHIVCPIVFRSFIHTYLVECACCINAVLLYQCSALLSLHVCMCAWVDLCLHILYMHVFAFCICMFMHVCVYQRTCMCSRYAVGLWTLEE